MTRAGDAGTGIFLSRRKNLVEGMTNLCIISNGESIAIRTCIATMHQLSNFVNRKNTRRTH